MLSALARWLFKVSGWRIVGPIPTVPKAIWLVAPHTTNWDFPVGLGMRPTMHIFIQFVAKNSLFTWYSGWLFRALGGIPVDRSRAHNFVETIVSLFNSRSTLHLCVTPEGTRSNVSKLKMGFYYMAQRANIPLILTGFDWERKLSILSEPFYVTGDTEKDMQHIADFFLQVHGPRKDWLKAYETKKAL